MVYKDSKKAKIIKIFQLEVGALSSKIIHPEVTILSYAVKHSSSISFQMARSRKNSLDFEAVGFKDVGKLTNQL